MRFWLGTHEVSWLGRLEVDLFISRRRLMRQKSLPVARGQWALDSGGFTELKLYGEWRTGETEYIEQVQHFQSEIGGLAWVAPQDWMCEPFMLEKTGLTVEEHQLRTILNFERLRYALGDLVVPVLQGWTQDDYLRHAEMYERFCFPLEKEPLVGLGTVCRRQDTDEAEGIVRALSPLSLHGFGVKITGLKGYGDQLASADSLAWSYRARKHSHEKSEPTMRLFEWPRQMLCGATHPSPHRASSCSNCLDWALKWRSDIVKEEVFA